MEVNDLKEASVATVERQKAKIGRMVEAMAKEQAKLLLAERAEARRKAREAMRQKAKEKAALFRAADAHRKILLGGLVIAAGADGWDEAEIVGALLAIQARLESHPQVREQLRRMGLDHLEARERARGGK